jgi:hypothetical protein
VDVLTAAAAEPTTTALASSANAMTFFIQISPYAITSVAAILRAAAPGMG